MQGLDVICRIEQHFVGAFNGHPALLSTDQGLLSVSLQETHAAANTFQPSTREQTRGAPVLSAAADVCMSWRGAGVRLLCLGSGRGASTPAAVQPPLLLPSPGEHALSVPLQPARYTYNLSKVSTQKGDADAPPVHAQATIPHTPAQVLLSLAPGGCLATCWPAPRSSASTSACLAPLLGPECRLTPVCAINHAWCLLVAAVALQGYSSTSSSPWPASAPAASL